MEKIRGNENKERKKSGEEIEMKEDIEEKERKKQRNINAKIEVFCV